MSSQAAESSVPAEFDFGVFWNRHRTKIIALGSLVVIGLILFAVFQVMEHRKAASARNLLLSARTPTGYQSVIEKYPGTMAAANARLLLAAQQREEHKFEEAIGTLESFIKNHPEHPLIGGARLSLGETQRAANQREEALQTFQMTTTQYPDSYGAPAAMLAEASMFLSDGKTEEARHVLEDLVSQFPESFMAQQAQIELRGLK